MPLTPRHSAPRRERNEFLLGVAFVPTLLGEVSTWNLSRESCAGGRECNSFRCDAPHHPLRSILGNDALMTKRRRRFAAKELTLCRGKLAHEEPDVPKTKPTRQ